MPPPHRCEGREGPDGREGLRRALGAVGVHRVGGRAQAGVRVGEAQLIVDLVEDEDELRGRTGEPSGFGEHPAKTHLCWRAACDAPYRCRSIASCDGQQV